MQDQINRFYEICLPESGRAFDPQGAHKALTEIEKSFALFLCLFDGAELIGTIAINKLTEEDCELRAVYLLEQHHGKGLGTRMIQEAIQYAKDYGFQKILLDTISSISQKAIRMYRKCGFTETKRYKSTLRSDLLMELVLR